MRASTAISLLFVGSLACANRGMQAPDGGPGAGGAGRGGQSGSVGTAGHGGTGGMATGAAGTGGPAGAAGTGASCDLPDGSASGGACGAMFNFESGTQGAMINAGSQMAFKTIAQSGAFTYCGAGALAISAMYSGTTGTSTKGEVLISLPGAPVDLTGKTITVHVASDPGCSADLYLSMVVNTQTGPLYFQPPFQIRPITSAWQTGSVTVTPDGGSTAALAVSLQMFSATGYQGTIYVDELDIR